MKTLDLVLAGCTGCGHLHWTGRDYVECPIRDCGCSGPMKVAGRDYPCTDWSCRLPHEPRRCGPVFGSYHPEEVKP